MATIYRLYDGKQPVLCFQTEFANISLLESQKHRMLLGERGILHNKECLCFLLHNTAATCQLTYRMEVAFSFYYKEWHNLQGFAIMHF